MRSRQQERARGKKWRRATYDNDRVTVTASPSPRGIHDSQPAYLLKRRLADSKHATTPAAFAVAAASWSSSHQPRS